MAPAPERYRVSVIGGLSIKSNVTLERAMQEVTSCIDRFKVMFIKDWVDNLVELRLDQGRIILTPYIKSATHPEWIRKVHIHDKENLWSSAPSP